MHPFANSRLFTPWKDPGSEVTLYILAHKVVPVQEAFYFVNDGMSADGRWLWFYCAFPPSGSASQGRTLAVVDFEAAVRGLYHTVRGKVDLAIIPARDLIERTT
jgi:hypothetical protein